jgi:hypothetical protein
LPITIPEGPETNATVEGINPIGNTSVNVTLEAALSVTWSVRSYRTKSPAFGAAGDPVFSNFKTAMGVGVKVGVAVKVRVGVGVQVGDQVGVQVQVLVKVFVSV